MSKRYPQLTGKELIKILNSHGFAVVRIKRSHHILKHPDGRSTVVPVHAGESIGPGLLKRIAIDADLISKIFER
jgi:predicted RNA binding protein YcfA (HicA-like mRNA interferase family)